MAPNNYFSNPRKISAVETYQLRQPVLRPGKLISECYFEGDELKSSLHLGIHSANKLVAVASFILQKNPEFDTPVQYQMRGMAVLAEAQRQKLGERLLLAGETTLRQQRGSLLIWFNARETAVEFYKKHGYKTYGAFFEIPNVCTHIVMFKML